MAARKVAAVILARAMDARAAGSEMSALMSMVLDALDATEGDIERAINTLSARIMERAEDYNVMVTERLQLIVREAVEREVSELRKRSSNVFRLPRKTSVLTTDKRQIEMFANDN